MRTCFLVALLITSTAAAQQYVISTVAGAPVGTTPVTAVTAPVGLPRSIAIDAAGDIFFTSFRTRIGVPGPADPGLFKLDPSGLLVRIARLPADFTGGIAVDNAGTVYIADTRNNRVEAVSIDGTITPVAIDAALDQPSVLAFDSDGNLYIADSTRIRKVSTVGVVTTIAGNGTPGYSGDAGPATEAQIGSVVGLAVDASGNLYFSENFRTNVLIDDEDTLVIQTGVRKVSADGIISTVAGTRGSNNSGGFASPGPLAVDRDGNLYITGNPYAIGGSRIFKVSSEGMLALFAGDGTNRITGDGPATNGGVFATALAVDSDRNVYIADNTERIRKVSTNGMISTLAGLGPLIGGSAAAPGDGGPASNAPLNSPVGVAVDSTGALYISDTYGNRIRRVSPDGAITTIAGLGSGGDPADGGTASSAHVFWPAGLAFDRAQNLYVADSGNSRIRVISPDGAIRTLAGSGLPGRPGYSGDGGPASGAVLNWPKDVAVDGSGNVYIADTGNNRIRMVSAAGIITTIAGEGAARYGGDGGPAIRADLNLPSGLAIDGQGNVYVADTNNYRVRKISSSGIITTVAGNGTSGYSGDGGLAVNAQLHYPVGIKLDGAGNIYIADGTSVRQISADGLIHTVAGTGVLGYSGDGGLSTSAQLGAWGLALDNAGDLYVADPWSSAVRLLTAVR